MNGAANSSDRAVLIPNPFRVDFYKNNILVLSANAKGLMRMEHLRTKASM